MPERMDSRLRRLLGRIDPAAAIIALIVALCLVNAIRHDPRIGYDAGEYIKYIRILAEGRLPLASETTEYFNPPLPFVIPALLRYLGLRQAEMLKGAQLVNVLLSLGTLVCLLRIARILFPGPEGRPFVLASLIFLGILPVYYKSLAFVRAEPYLMFFTVALLAKFVRVEAAGDYSFRNAVSVGALFGACLLSRQSGYFVLPMLAVYLLLAARRRLSDLRRIVSFLAAALAVAAVVSGWFFVSLAQRYGTPIAFNRAPAESFSLSNQPLSFYIGRGGTAMWTNPVRGGSFRNQLLPILYSEMWGDYWQYFVVYGRDISSGGLVSGQDLYQRLQQGHAPGRLLTNRYEIAPYLGRVNLVSLVPSTVALAGLLLAILATLRAPPNRSDDLSHRVLALATFLVIAAACAYLFFLIQFPDPGKGGAIKATYLLHVLPFGALLAAYGIRRISRVGRWVYPAVMGSFGIVFLHNLGAMVSRYVP